MENKPLKIFTMKDINKEQVNKVVLEAQNQGEAKPESQITHLKNLNNIINDLNEEIEEIESNLKYGDKKDELEFKKQSSLNAILDRSKLIKEGVEEFNLPEDKCGLKETENAVKRAKYFINNN